MTKIKAYLTCKLTHDNDLWPSERSKRDKELREYLQQSITKEPYNSMDLELSVDDTIRANGDDMLELARNIAADIRAEYDFFDGFQIIVSPTIAPYVCAALSYALENLGKPVVVARSEYYECESSFLLINGIAETYYFCEDALAWRGVYYNSNKGVYIGTRIDNEFQFREVNEHGQPFTPVRDNKVHPHVDTKLLESYTRCYGSAAFGSSGLSIKANFDTNIISLDCFPGQDWTKMSAMIDFLAPKAVILRDFNSVYTRKIHNYQDKKKLDFFCHCQERRVNVIVMPRTRLHDELLTECFGSWRNEKHVEIQPVMNSINLFDISMECAVVKLMWLLGQGVDYDKIGVGMRRNIRGEFGVKAIS